MQKVFLPLAIVCVAFIAGGAVAKPDRVVLAYSATWRDLNSPPESYDFDALSYLARAFLAPHPDGSIEVPEGYFNATMESLARQHGVKLLMSLGGEASNADNWLSIARHPEYFERFCGDLAKLLADHGYDGIDIDWEPSATTTGDGAAFTSFLKKLRGRFPNQIITTALGASEYWIGHFDWPEITDNVDYVNVMTYDYSGGWGGRAAYCSNLFPAGAYVPEATLSAEEGMTNLIEGHKVSPTKLLMGITFWPSRFAVNHIGDRFPVNGAGWSMNITYAQVMCLLRSGKYAAFWDEKAEEPYTERVGGGSVVVYENPRSIRLKCDYAAKLGCAGVMIWHVGADLYGDRTPLMDAVAESVGAATPDLPRIALEAYVVDLQQQIEDLKLHLPADTAPADENAAIAKLSTLTDEQLLELRAELETKWAALQDQIWEQDAPRAKNGR